MGIPAKDLRIGNIIQWGDRWTKVDINMLKDWDDVYRSRAIGEPLDEGWLTGWGFEKDKKENYYQLEGVKVWFVENEGVNQFYHINDELLKHFSTVHDFQNWYYANTEEELQTKEPVNTQLK